MSVESLEAAPHFRVYDDTLDRPLYDGHEPLEERPIRPFVELDAYPKKEFPNLARFILNIEVKENYL